VVPLAIGFQMLGFFASQYLNETTASSQRATVLSFKSLAGNLAYGAVGAAYAIAFSVAGGGTTPAPGSPEEEAVLGATLIWLPVALLVVNIPLWLWGRRLPRMRAKPAREGEGSQ